MPQGIWWLKYGSTCLPNNTGQEGGREGRAEKEAGGVWAWLLTWAAACVGLGAGGGGFGG